MKVLQKEIKDPNGAKYLFRFYHDNDKKTKEITLNTIFEADNVNIQDFPRYPHSKKFAVVLTHDVDLVKPSWKYYAYHMVRKSLTGVKLLIKRKNPYDTFTKIVEIEKSFGAKSTFFFMAADRDPTGVRYKIENFRETIEMLLDEGFEVGLHGSFTAYKDFNQMKMEKQRLEKVVGSAVVGYRNHYLRFKIPDTWRLLEKVGLKYDSTLGYNDLAGFRGGIPYPFWAFDPQNGEEFRILEIPLNVMDVTLFEYMKLSVEKAFKFVKQLMNIVEKYHGVLTLNWHNDKFDELYWKYYEELYIKVLKEAKRRRAWLTNCKELMEWLGK